MTIPSIAAYTQMVVRDAKREATQELGKAKRVRIALIATAIFVAFAAAIFALGMPGFDVFKRYAVLSIGAPMVVSLLMLAKDKKVVVRIYKQALASIMSGKGDQSNAGSVFNEIRERQDNVSFGVMSAGMFPITLVLPCIALIDSARFVGFVPLGAALSSIIAVEFVSRMTARR